MRDIDSQSDHDPQTPPEQMDRDAALDADGLSGDEPGEFSPLEDKDESPPTDTLSEDSGVLDESQSELRLADADGDSIELTEAAQENIEPAQCTEEEGPAVRDEGDADADTDTLEAPEGTGEQEITTERVVEAVLFASDAPLPLSKIVSILGVGSARDVRGHIKTLNERYEKTGASFRIEQIASGYQMLTLPVYNTWIRRLKQNNKDNKLSQPAMETLAVVAYKQPVVRADIEAIRGVAAGEMLNRLRELGLIKIVGRAEDVGRPMLYGTTKRFLEVFGLSSLEDLPAVEELQSGE